MWARDQKLGVRGCVHAAAVAGAEVVFCTVTAEHAVVAAAQAAIHLERGAFWCDCNSCAPSSKRQAAEVIEAPGGLYVDVAVMAPVHPKRNMTPLLISGPHAEAIESILESLPMAPKLVAGEVGGVLDQDDPLGDGEGAGSADGGMRALCCRGLRFGARAGGVRAGGGCRL
jgi:3-hydroxyisobutyrate dehydrogenase-like beta-hydroxyacid dehydrogenase